MRGAVVALLLAGVGAVAMAPIRADPGVEDQLAGDYATSSERVGAEVQTESEVGLGAPGRSNMGAGSGRPTHAPGVPRTRGSSFMRFRSGGSPAPAHQSVRQMLASALEGDYSANGQGNADEPSESAQGDGRGPSLAMGTSGVEAETEGQMAIRFRSSAGASLIPGRGMEEEGRAGRAPPRRAAALAKAAGSGVGGNDAWNRVDEVQKAIEWQKAHPLKLPDTWRAGGERSMYHAEHRFKVHVADLTEEAQRTAVFKGTRQEQAAADAADAAAPEAALPTNAAAPDSQRGPAPQPSDPAPIPTAAKDVGSAGDRVAAVAAADVSEDVESLESSLDGAALREAVDTAAAADKMASSLQMAPDLAPIQVPPGD